MEYIKRNLNQDLVYWGSPVDDGYGRQVFSSPIQLKGRWEDKTDLVKNRQGEEFVSNAKVLVDRKVNEGGYLILGTLIDYPGNDPVSYGASRILKYNETPNLRTNKISAVARM